MPRVSTGNHWGADLGQRLSNSPRSSVRIDRPHSLLSVIRPAKLSFQLGADQKRTVSNGSQASARAVAAILTVTVHCSRFRTHNSLSLSRRCETCVVMVKQSRLIPQDPKRSSTWVCPAFQTDHRTRAIEEKTADDIRASYAVMPRVSVASRNAG